MHWRAHSDRMTDFATYDEPGGVVAAVRDELAARVEAMLAAGIAPDRVVLDPGLGFAKRGGTTGSCWPTWPRSRRWATRCWSAPAASRSSAACWRTRTAPRPVDEREHATTALSVVLAQAGVWGLRVHDVRSCRDALRVLDALEAGRRADDRRARPAGLECWGHHGVFEHERREGQPFVIDLVLGSTPPRRRLRTTCQPPWTTAVSRWR